MTAVTAGSRTQRDRRACARSLPQLAPFLGILAVAMLLPFVSNDYWALIGTRAAIYWVLVSGLNLVVGFAGHLAIGYVALLTLGAYTTSVLVAGNVMPPLAGLRRAAARRRASAPCSASSSACRRCGCAPSISRCRRSASPPSSRRSRWPGRASPAAASALPARSFRRPSIPPGASISSASAFAALCTWMSANVAHSRFGRALIAIRDAEVAAEATGISKPRMLIAIFLFAGALAAIAGGLFASLQTYITPDAFTFDLSVLFFIAILIGGRGSILGPMLGTIILTILPEFAAPLAAWSTFLYAVLLLVIVLAMPGGIAAPAGLSQPPSARQPTAPSCRVPVLLGRTSLAIRRGAQDPQPAQHRAELRQCARDRRARSRCQARPGARPDRPQRQRQDHDAERDLAATTPPKAGTMTLGRRDAAARHAADCARGSGIARTFQTPRVIGEASVLQNVMIGGTIEGSATFVEALLALPRHRRDERRGSRARPARCCGVVGLEALADVRADRLQHSELRFIEIARALMLRAGLSCCSTNRRRVCPATRSSGSAR